MEKKIILNSLSMNIESVYIRLTCANDNAIKDDMKDVYFKRNNIWSATNFLKELQCRSKKNLKTVGFLHFQLLLHRKDEGKESSNKFDTKFSYKGIQQ